VGVARRFVLCVIFCFIRPADKFGDRTKLKGTRRWFRQLSREVVVSVGDRDLVFQDWGLVLAGALPQRATLTRHASEGRFRQGDAFVWERFRSL
jgi:hypothetical protein